MGFGILPIKSKKLDSFDRETIEIVAGLEVEAAEYQLDMDSVLLSREQMRKALHHENSYLGNIGKIIEPAIDHWASTGNWALAYFRVFLQKKL